MLTLEHKPYLIFSLNSSLYGIEAQFVQEIFSLPELTPVAEAPRSIIGVVNLRGDILPIMDINLRLGYQQPEYCVTDSVIVLERLGWRVGIIVNQVNEVHNISRQDITKELSYRREFTINSANHIVGIAKVEADIIMLLNEESLFSYSEAFEKFQEKATSERLETEERESKFRDIFPAKYPIFCPHATPEERAIFRERAQNLRKSTDKQDFAGLVALAVIGLNGEYFGLDLKLVREFTNIRKVTPVPCCPPHIVGNMNLRGEILTLVDIRGVLNMPILGRENISKVTIVRVDDTMAGVTVDEVFDVMYLHPSEISSVPTAVHSINDEYLRGTAPYREKMMSFLDLAKIFKKGDLVVNEEA